MMFVLEFWFPDKGPHRMRFLTWGALQSWLTKFLDAGFGARASFEPN